MSDDNKNQKKEDVAKDDPEKADVDIQEDRKDDEAVKTQEETERGKRPKVTKGSGKPTRDSSDRKGSGSRPARGQKRDRYEETEWTPLTKLGNLVKSGKVTSMHGALNSGLPFREPQIVDTLIGEDLVDEVLKVNMVQRMTDSGRRTRFSITVVVGNNNGYVGLGSARGKEVGPTIKKAIDNAKLNMIELKRGCGSWECGCMNPHSIPFRVEGKAGSTTVTLRPAPRGVGLAVGDVAKKILKLAGINDAWGFSRGQTKTTVNNAKAVMDALKGTTLMRVQKDQRIRLKHLSGPVAAPSEPVTTEGGEMQ
jgi:small subunit ribosomal protein S5